MFLNLAIIMLIGGGLAVEMLGVFSMICYPLRRRLPLPFALISFGGIAWALGVLLVGFRAACQSF